MAEVAEVATQQHEGVPVGAQPMSNEQARGLFDEAFSKNPVMKEDFERMQAKRREKEAKAQGNQKPVAEKPKAEKPAVEAKPEETIVEQAEPEEEVVTETAPEETASEETPAADDKSQKRWGELKKVEKEYKKLQAEIKAQQTQAQAWEAEKTELSSKLKEYERYKTELDSAYQELQVTRIEAHPEYKKAVTEPRNRVFSDLMQIAERSKVDPKALIEAIHKDSIGDPDALQDFVDGNAIHDRWKSRIYDSATNLAQIGEREKDLRENSKEALATLNRRQQEELQQRQEFVTKERAKAAENTSSKFAERLGKILPEGHGLDFDAIKGDSQKFDGLDEPSKVYAAYAGYSLPKVIEAYEKQAAELKEAKAALAKFRSSGPKTTQGTSAPDKPQQKSGASRDELAKMSSTDFGKMSMDRLFNRAA